MKTLLIYDEVAPVNRQDHGDWSLKKGKTYEYARETNAVPLVLAEFPPAAPHYAIVFTDTSEGVLPTAILGARDNENAYVGKDGHWDAPYVPAFVRRYPFVFSTDEKAENFTLMIDPKYKGFNQKGRGERLFDAEGAQTEFLNGTLNFLREYQNQFVPTRAFGARLNELGLLEPVEARISLPKDPDRRLTGFKIVNRDRLKALSGDVLSQMLKADEMELVFLHLFSLANLGRLHERVAPRPSVA